MFSFFKTKKPSPSSSPESDPIPSGNDFVIVDQRQGGADPSKPQHQAPYPIYPNFDQHFSGYPGVPPMPPMPMYPVRPTLQHSDSVQNTTYVHDIPFKLSPQISMGNSDEITRIQVDDILASITSKMQLTQIDYDFTLERSLLQQAASDTTDAPIAEAEEDEEPADEGEKEGDE